MGSVRKDDGWRLPFTLFVGNIKWSTSEEDLKFYFGCHGLVLQVVSPRDKISGKSRGFGFVQLQHRKQHGRLQIYVTTKELRAEFRGSQKPFRLFSASMKGAMIDVQGSDVTIKKDEVLVVPEGFAHDVPSCKGTVSVGQEVVGIILRLLATSLAALVYVRSGLGQLLKKSHLGVFGCMFLGFFCMLGQTLFFWQTAVHFGALVEITAETRKKEALSSANLKILLKLGMSSGNVLELRVCGLAFPVWVQVGRGILWQQDGCWNVFCSLANSSTAWKNSERAEDDAVCPVEEKHTAASDVKHYGCLL